MKKIYTACSPVDLAHAQNIVAMSGIATQKRNELFSVRGEIPFIECWPELWVIDDRDEARARQLIEAAINRPETGKTWQCLGCGETCADQFTDCWQCGASRD